VEVEAGTSFFLFFFVFSFSFRDNTRTMRYSTVRYVVVGEEQRPDRRYHVTANMYRICM